MRPIYENEDTKKVEAEMAVMLAAQFRCQMLKLQMKSVIDFLALRDGLAVAWVEVKARPTYTWQQIDRMGGYMLSYEKFEAGIRKMTLTGMRFVIGVMDMTGDYRLAIFTEPPKKPYPYPIKWGGRTDRGDRQDLEPVVLIPVSAFTWKIKQKELALEDAS